MGGIWKEQVLSLLQEQVVVDDVYHWNIFTVIAGVQTMW